MDGSGLGSVARGGEGAGPAGGGSTTAPALAALVGAREALDAARGHLLAADDVEWVSSAASRYRRRLDEAAHDVARLVHQLHGAEAAVVRHTRTADEARAVALAAPSDLSVRLGLVGLAPFPWDGQATAVATSTVPGPADPWGRG